MKTHFQHLLDVVPDLQEKKVLDLGSGRGSFLIDCAKSGVQAEGLELNENYIETTKKRAAEAGVIVSISQGVGEKLPYGSEHFDFINLCEVIEHVSEPEVVLTEVFRVLRPNGLVYMSVPNRFGMKDQHFDLYGINWLPRAWSDAFISIFGTHKEYGGTIGHQRLADMHYYTYGSIRHLCEKHGFAVSDIRVRKIQQRFPGFKGYVVMAVYHILKSFYFDSFHLLLGKPKRYNG